MRRAYLWTVAAFWVMNAAAEGFLPNAFAQYSRRTPVVEAVARSQPSIVTIKATKRSGSGRESVGTGVVVDERGYVVTCNHVVAGARELRVLLADGSEFTPRVLVAEPGHDLAVLQVQAGRTLPALPLGPSSDLLVGETVIAVGHPFGYTHTVSTGIISSATREITLPEGPVLEDLIQTTASINPGNSGGPLLNINGEWIGLTVAMRDGAQGIAFALKSDTLKKVLSRHLSALKVAGLKHGIVCQERVSEEDTRRQRVQVDSVAEQSPAASAGLRAGDTILRVADQTVANRFDVERALWGRTAGDHVELTVLRQDRELRLTLTLSRAGEASARR